MRQAECSRTRTGSVRSGLPTTIATWSRRPSPPRKTTNSVSGAPFERHRRAAHDPVSRALRAAIGAHRLARHTQHRNIHRLALHRNDERRRQHERRAASAPVRPRRARDGGATGASMRASILSASCAMRAWSMHRAGDDARLLALQAKPPQPRRRPARAASALGNGLEPRAGDPARAPRRLRRAQRGSGLRPEPAARHGSPQAPARPRSGRGRSKDGRDETPWTATTARDFRSDPLDLSYGRRLGVQVEGSKGEPLDVERRSLPPDVHGNNHSAYTCVMRSNAALVGFLEPSLNGQVRKNLPAERAVGRSPLQLTGC